MGQNEEVAMTKRTLIAAAIVLALAALRPDIASAQWRAGGFRGAMIGSGFGRVGIGFRTAAIGSAFGSAWRPGWGWNRWNSGLGWRPGWGWRGGLGWNAGLGWRPGWGWRGGWAWRRGWGWPVAAGLALGAFSSYASYASPWYASDDQCWAWNGFGWVNICYQASGYW